MKLSELGILFSTVHKVKKEKIGIFPLNTCVNIDCLLGLDKIEDGSLDVVITDCPFAIKNGKPDTENYNRLGENVMEGYKEVPIEEYEAFSKAWISKVYRKLKKYGTLVVVSSWSNQREILNAGNDAGFYLTNQLIWKYNFGLFTKKKLVSSHYNIFVFTKHKSKFTFNKLNWYCEDVIQSEDFDVEILDIKREYWTGKIKTPNKLPKELVEMLVFYYSNPDDIVLDCFSGSGTILKVCSYTGRYCLAFEIVPKFAEFSNYRLKELDY